jgi:hypothetical protein
MNRDDIIRMAREAGFVDGLVDIIGFDGFANFAALVAAAEREACAQLCESYENDMGYGQPQQCANAIRTRGEK